MFKNYLLTAYKIFMRRKLFTAINLACIVLTLVVLLVITAVLQNTFQPTGVEGKSDRFVQVIIMESTRNNGNAQMRTPVGYKLIDKYLRPMKSVAMVAAVTMPETVSVYQDGQVSALTIRRADANYWKILDFKVLAGRVPNADDVALGRHVAVLNASTAAKLYPGQAALGKKLSAGGQQFEVLGVVEDVLHLNAFGEIWVPVTTFPSTAYRDQLAGNFTALLMARTPAGVPAIQKEIEQVAKSVVFDDPNSWDKATFWGDSKLDFFARMLLSSNQADSGAAALLSIIGALMVLFMLLPALNLVNLNVGRIMERSSEIGVRKAFGATSGQLVAQLVLENVLLCLAGGVLALGCTYAALVWIEASGLIPYLKLSLNFTVFGYGLLVTIVFGVLSGIIPAWKMSRLDPVHALKGVA